MGVVVGTRDHDVVKPPRSFTRVVQANGASPIGQPRHDATAEKALQIDHPIEAVRAELLKAVPGFLPAQWRSPPFAFKWDSPGQVRISLKQGNEPPIKPPINFARGQLLFQKPQNREGLDDISERTRFE